MGINPTALYKAFTFGGESSADYGAFLTGEGVFNAPERAVEMIEVPGRNGSFAMDMGRFENVELTYKASIVDVTSTDFADRISALRNWLCSKRGYIRLEDDYNPDEYRMAVYKSGLEVEALDLKAGEFDIVFECKPQRWLKSGETSETITSGNTITNPTLFDAEPLLEVKGYGGIEFNGYEIDVENAVLGELYIADGEQFATTDTFDVDSDIFNNGDTINIAGNIVEIIKGVSLEFGTPSYSDSDTDFSTSYVASSGGNKKHYSTSFGVQFSVGTSATKTNTASFSCTSFLPPSTQTWTITQTIAYNAGAGTITFTMSYSTTTSNVTYPATVEELTGESVTIVGDSTVSALGNPTYIDCEIGEAYMIKNGNIVSCNSAVALGSDLPKLAPGANTITYDNTVTELKIHPRWWRV